MKILITGALGHIGSELIRVLPQHFNAVELVLIDNLMTQRYPSLFNLPNTAKYQFIPCDILATDLNAILPDVDYVIHLAAMTDAASSFDKKDEIKKNNFKSTEAIVNSCIQYGCKLIFPSSTSVYGTQDELVDEDCLPEDLKPQSPYAETKLLEEAYVLKAIQEKNLHANICRFGTIFGISQGMRFHTAVNKFCWQAVLNIPLTIWETAYEQKRPYLDLKDACRVICFFIEQDLINGKIYNVVTSNHTVHEVIDVIKHNIPHTRCKFVKDRIMNQLSYEVANKYLNELGFTFTGSLSNGIRDTINLIKNINTLTGEIK